MNDVELRREILSGPLSAGINMKRKEMSGSVCVRRYMPWGPSSAHTQVKNKRLDLKVEVKRRVSAHRLLCVTFMPHTWKITRWRCF